MLVAEERRRHTRYTLGDSAIAVLGNHPGHIKDISMGGLAFVYLDGDRPSPQGDMVDILDGQKNYFIENISCTTISEKRIVNESSYNLIRMVKRGLMFQDLSEEQKSKLKAYILSYAAE